MSVFIHESGTDRFEVSLQEKKSANLMEIKSLAKTFSFILKNLICLKYIPWSH